MDYIKHREKKIRFKIIYGQIWCALCDIAKAEHMGHPGDFKKKLPSECTMLHPLKDKKGRLQETILINLEGIYLLLGKSLIEKLENMPKFQEEISQKNELKKHQMKSVIKSLLDIWE